MGGINAVSRVRLNSKQASNFWIMFLSRWSQYAWLFIGICKPRALSDESRHSHFHMYHIKINLLQQKPKSVDNLNCSVSSLLQEFPCFFLLSHSCFYTDFIPSASTSLTMIMSICILWIYVQTAGKLINHDLPVQFWSGFAFKEMWSQIRNFHLISLMKFSTLSPPTLIKSSFSSSPDPERAYSSTTADSGSTKWWPESGL